MSKHTPGPWAWHETDQTLFGLAGVVVIKDNGSYEGLAINDWDRVTKEQAAANMALIAAAPELLSALDELVDALTAGYVPQRDGSMLKEARALIAKAEGTPTPNSTTLLSAVSAEGE